MKIIWTKRAAQGYGRMLNHIDKQWTITEVKSFETDIKSFLKKLSQHPYLLIASNTK